MCMWSISWNTAVIFHSLKHFTHYIIGFYISTISLSLSEKMLSPSFLKLILFLMKNRLQELKWTISPKMNQYTKSTEHRGPETQYTGDYLQFMLIWLSGGCLSYLLPLPSIKTVLYNLPLQEEIKFHNSTQGLH